jgi:uncharacterized membrane protein
LKGSWPIPTKATKPTSAAKTRPQATTIATQCPFSAGNAAGLIRVKARDPDPVLRFFAEMYRRQRTEADETVISRVGTVELTVKGGHRMQHIATRDAAPMAISGVTVEQVPFDAPWAWLAAGWRDLCSAPHIGFTYGAVFAALSAALVLGLMVTGLASLTLALAGGFLLVGPVAAVGLYETSRRLESGRRVELGDVLTSGLRGSSQLGFFGAILAFAYFVWLQLAFLLFMLFLGSRGLPPPSEFVPTLLFTPHGLGLLVTGSIVGGALALLVFAISVISVPLLMTRRLDAVTAIATSLAAVRLNPKPLALWAGLIAGFMALAIATVFVGLVIAFPLIGHASWHAFRALVSEQPNGYL